MKMKNEYKLIRIPGGTFMMGAPKNDERRSDDEEPLHEVNISEFFMGRYPVTNQEYEVFLRENPTVPKPDYWMSQEFNQPSHPVVGVSWEDAMKFAKWAGGRLPTEAEWEYACRAGTTTRFYTGDSEDGLNRAGWFDWNSFGKTHSVGKKEPNAFGLYDMHGNVGEWCSDWYGEDYYGKSPASDPTGPASGTYRVVRGGSWANLAKGCRSAYRDYIVPGYRFSFIGFRVAQDIRASDPEKFKKLLRRSINRIWNDPEEQKNLVSRMLESGKIIK